MLMICVSTQTTCILLVHSAVNVELINRNMHYAYE